VIFRPMTEEDWERPLLYLNRIKLLNLRSDTWILSTTAFQQICATIPGGGAHIFPNLGTLSLHYRRFSSRETPTARSIPFLVSPRITDIRLSFSHDDRWGRVMIGILDSLVDCCPSLTRADVSVCDESVLDRVSRFVLNLTRIKVLVVHNINEAAFTYLASLPSLMTLKLDDLTVTLPVVLDTSMAYSYSSLRNLHFESTTGECVIAFLNLIVNGQLQNLHIEGLDDSEPTTADAFGRLCSALVARSSHAELESITIPNCGYPEITDHSIFMVTGRVLRQLCCFKNLVRLLLDQPGGFDLTDKDVFVMASSWPQLEMLALGGKADARTDSRVTLHSLSVFAQHCPKLRFLQIMLNATVVSELEPDTRRHVVLKDLNVSYAHIEEAPPVASYISAVFPKAALEYGWWVHEDEESDEATIMYAGRWGEVKALLKKSVAEGSK